MRAGVWNQCVFVNLEGNAPPLEEILAPISELYGDCDLDALRLDATIVTLEFKSSWKLVQDNWENYHGPYLHQKFMGMQAFIDGDKRSFCHYANGCCTSLVTPMANRRSPPRRHVRHRARARARQYSVRRMGDGVCCRVRHVVSARLCQGNLDATVALALAAQAAGSGNGAAIRDRLRAVASRPGTVVSAGPQGVADALRILAQGGEIDYAGAAGSMDWDGNGDLRRGHIGIRRFTGNERIEDIGAVPFVR